LNITLFYLSQREASSEKVRTMLKRRLYRMKQRGEEVPPGAEQWIENVIQKVQDLSYLNDNRYAENQIRQMIAQGKSERHMVSKLATAGISADTVRQLLQDADSDELERAKRFAQKKKLGIYRTEKSEELDRKDLAKMARAGFSYETARQVLQSKEE
jgi:regulatory protein